MCSSNIRHVSRSENLEGRVVLGGDNVPPLVKIGLTDLPKTRGAYAPTASPLKTCLIVGGLLLHPRAGWGLIFWTMNFYNPKKFISRSNEGSKIVLSSLELVFYKLLKHGHFGINFRFWLV